MLEPGSWACRTRREPQGLRVHGSGQSAPGWAGPDLRAQDEGKGGQAAAEPVASSSAVRVSGERRWSRETESGRRGASRAVHEPRCLSPGRCVSPDVASGLRTSAQASKSMGNVRWGREGNLARAGLLSKQFTWAPSTPAQRVCRLPSG